MKIIKKFRKGAILVFLGHVLTLYPSLIDPPPHQTKKFIFHPTPQPLNTLAQSTQFGHSLEIMRKLQQLSTTPTDGSTSSVNILFTHLNRWNFRSGWKHGGFTFVVRREGKKASNTRKR